MTYATLSDLAAYLHVTEEELPPDAERLLERASEMMERVTRGRYKPARASAEVREYVIRATCAQVEYWLKAGEEGDIEGGVHSYRAGSVYVMRYQNSTGATSQLSSRLAPRARDALALTGLMYAGIGVRAGFYQGDDPR